MGHSNGGKKNKDNGAGIRFLREHVRHTGDECLIWPMCRDNHGYALCWFGGKSRKAARLMCELVHGPAPSPKHHTAHSWGKGQEACVHPRHVRWATPKENMADSVRLGAVKQKGQPRRKLTEEDVAKIMSMKGTLPYDKIGAMFGVKGKQIGKIYRGEQWIGGMKTHRGQPVGTFPSSRVRRLSVGE